MTQDTFFFNWALIFLKGIWKGWETSGKPRSSKNSSISASARRWNASFQYVNDFSRFGQPQLEWLTEFSSHTEHQDFSSTSYWLIIKINPKICADYWMLLHVTFRSSSSTCVCPCLIQLALKYFSFFFLALSLCLLRQSLPVCFWFFMWLVLFLIKTEFWCQSPC